MFRDNLRGRDLRRLGLLIGLVLALAGCGQLGSLQPPVSQQAQIAAALSVLADSLVRLNATRKGGAWGLR
jgi:predicted small lipoprotein YifL